MKGNFLLPARLLDFGVQPTIVKTFEPKSYAAKNQKDIARMDGPTLLPYYDRGEPAVDYR